MSEDEEDFEYAGSISVTYGRTNEPDLNEKLNRSASFLGGEFTSHTEQDEVCIREYKFEDEDQADSFMEQANLDISRFFKFEPIDLDDFFERARWTFDEAIYHHVEFTNMEIAQRFATWLRATYSTYLDVDMFDVFILNPIAEDGGPVVIYAFPIQSVISKELVDDESDDEMDEIEEIMSSVNVKKNDGNGGLLN